MKVEEIIAVPTDPSTALQPRMQRVSGGGQLSVRQSW
ncbi:hypothetical protein M2281_001671 [Mesorhizobium soli]|nr:hypothetical protein [Mesorhizobium soli]